MLPFGPDDASVCRSSAYPRHINPRLKSNFLGTNRVLLDLIWSFFPSPKNTCVHKNRPHRGGLPAVEGFPFFFQEWCFRLWILGSRDNLPGTCGEHFCKGDATTKNTRGQKTTKLSVRFRNLYRHLLTPKKDAWLNKN